MDRRKFLKSGMNKVGELLINATDAKARKQARRWIRPPFALDELDFLATCTRCGDCIQACPHQVVFPLATRLGAVAALTPALDLTHSACHLCADWPCVTACKEDALRLPPMADPVDAGPPSTATQADAAATAAKYPQLALAAIDEQQCLPYRGPDCGACRSACPVSGAMSWSRGRPSINDAVCVGCGLCREACITEPKSVTIRSLHSTGARLPVGSREQE